MLIALTRVDIERVEFDLGAVAFFAICRLTVRIEASAQHTKTQCTLAESPDSHNCKHLKAK